MNKIELIYNLKSMGISVTAGKVKKGDIRKALASGSFKVVATNNRVEAFNKKGIKDTFVTVLLGLLPFSCGRPQETDGPSSLPSSPDAVQVQEAPLAAQPEEAIEEANDALEDLLSDWYIDCQIEQHKDKQVWNFISDELGDNLKVSFVGDYDNATIEEEPRTEEMKEIQEGLMGAFKDNKVKKIFKDLQCDVEHIEEEEPPKPLTPQVKKDLEKQKEKVEREEQKKTYEESQQKLKDYYKEQQKVQKQNRNKNNNSYQERMRKYYEQQRKQQEERKKQYEDKKKKPQPETTPTPAP